MLNIMDEWGIELLKKLIKGIVLVAFIGFVIWLIIG